MMTNLKQLDRLVLKIARLKDIYKDYLVVASEEQTVFLNGKKIEKGEKWGEEFSVGKFSFTYQKGGNKAPYLYAEDGGVERLLLADGKPFGISDYLPGGKDAVFRRHKYVSLAEVRDGATITAESYASHTFYGTMPFEKKQTFAVDGYRPDRVYNGIYVVEIDPVVQKFVADLELLTSFFVSFRDGDVRKADAYGIYERLFETLTVLPERTPDIRELIAADTIIERFLYGLKERTPERADKSLPYLGVIGHSHLDTAWLWTVEESRRKAARTAANAVTLLKRYPKYRFIMSSVLYLSWIEKDYPSLFEDIKRLTKEGRFEPNGATFVECDCNLTGGEAMIRQFLRGKRYLREKLGYEADVFWLPDTFGYSAALPQILRGCRVPYFLTTKLSWNDTNKFPYESFLWKGIDGSEVTVHFNTIQSKADPEFLTSRLDKRLNKHMTKHMLVAYGYGDGGGGPDADMVENALKTQETYPYANVEHTTVSDFMKKLASERLPEYAGELYLELHRGTLTANHEMKRLNRKLENALSDAELLSVGQDRRDLKEETDKFYDVLLLNQFHDILPGTCIHEVYETALKENETALTALNRRFEKGEYFNTLCFARSEVLPCKDGRQHYTDLDGNTVGVDIYDFQPYSYGERTAGGTETKIPFAVKEDAERIVLRTPFYEAELKEGKISSLKFGGREIAEAPLNRIAVFEDVPYLWDNWDIDADYEKKACEVRVLSSEISSTGSVELRIRTEYLLAGKSKLIQDTVFYAHSPLIAFESKLEWKDEHKFVKAYFPTNILSDRLKSEIQFGCIDRPTSRGTSEEQAKYEVCNHKWSDLSEPRFGVAVLNDGKYGVSANGKTIGLSLLKSGKRPDVVGETGTKYFNYALLPHEGGFTAEQVVLPAYAFNRKPVRCQGPLNLPVRGVSVPDVLVETIKFAEEGDGVVLRLYEAEGSLCGCELYLNDEYAVYACDMLEENPVFLARGKNILLSFKQFEIKTLLLKK